MCQGIRFSKHSQIADVGYFRDGVFEASGQQRNLSGKSGRGFFKNFDIGHPSNEYSVRANQQVWYHFDGCRFIGQRAAIEGRNSNLFVVEDNCNNEVESNDLFDSNDGTRAMLGGAVIA